MSQTDLRVPTIENNLEASADHVQQATRENRPGTFWGAPTRDSMDILPPRISSTRSDQVRFRQRLDDQIQNDGMSKICFGPPAHPLERDLESQLEDVPMVKVVRAEDSEAVVNADRKKGRKNNGAVAKQNTRTGNLNKDRKKRRRY